MIRINPPPTNRVLRTTKGGGERKLLVGRDPTARNQQRYLTPRGMVEKHLRPDFAPQDLKAGIDTESG
jgi:hypothetical protein